MNASPLNQRSRFPSPRASRGERVPEGWVRGALMYPFDTYYRRDLRGGGLGPTLRFYESGLER